ncbi:MAG: bile acid:sodium symporter [Magnetospirillum sp.]|nr:bile acid:sodium symporter [Magnetospirillum sp.]
MRWINRLQPDGFTLAVLATLALAVVLPARGAVAQAFGTATTVAIGLLFFLHGVRLPRETVVAGLAHWRLHLLVLSATFVLFPALGLLAGLLARGVLTPNLAVGVLFLCCLPSTVQSSIAFTAIAGGNVPAAVCSASASNLIGVFLTPLLVGLLISARGSGASLDSIEAIVLQLLAPFAAGQILHPRLGRWAERHRRVSGLVDRGSILMVVFGAFSAATVHHIWRQLPVSGLGAMAVIDGAILAAALASTTWASRSLGFAREDEIAIVFCGSKKSLASGVPMANILFAGPALGTIVLPLMLFHQIQLMACAVLARRYAVRGGGQGSST